MGFFSGRLWPLKWGPEPCRRPAPGVVDPTLMLPRQERSQAPYPRKDQIWVSQRIITKIRYICHNKPEKFFLLHTGIIPYTQLIILDKTLQSLLKYTCTSVITNSAPLHKFLLSIFLYIVHVYPADYKSLGSMFYCTFIANSYGRRAGVGGLSRGRRKGSRAMWARWSCLTTRNQR